MRERVMRGVNNMREKERSQQTHGYIETDRGKA